MIVIIIISNMVSFIENTMIIDIVIILVMVTIILVIVHDMMIITSMEDPAPLLEVHHNSINCLLYALR